MYNILVEEEFSIVDYRVPIETFIEMLEEGELPEELAVSGLDDALTTENQELLSEMQAAMRQRRDWLDSRPSLPTVQFVVDGELQDTGESFELLVDGEFYSLKSVFGRSISEREPGWLVTSYRI
ncbi:hypothetical protein NDI76_19535 [Halogeometricum sp. S1BR25-6]|uniref:DUF8076 domain-containing protein n=1 Tax=Halogeometricum salsisoli TaxID=2950536 RepID=A0ABU2GL06_9EURY|nr:hypothetical protein [Halogeometricum sp. S1BR25-6]MDS0300943.1 hypothetical protein [Halogeometricum sp. S1BR25-6]